VPQRVTHQSAFTTTAQSEFRRGGRRRLLVAGLLAVLALAALIVFGPDQQSIKERFEFYGAPDEMRIMNEISIENGRDRTELVPRSLRVPPPPAHLVIEDEREDPDGTEVMPVPKKADPNRGLVDTKNPLINAEISEDYQVEMSLPMQTNRDFFIIHLVRPEYPLGASQAERRTPVIVVKVGLFVDPTGTVTETMILASNGSQAYEDEALTAVREWKFGWLVEPGAGRWLQFPFNFKSPYFNPGR
jgi:TonB family protein